MQQNVFFKLHTKLTLSTHSPEVKLCQMAALAKYYCHMQQLLQFDYGKLIDFASILLRTLSSYHFSNHSKSKRNKTVAPNMVPTKFNDFNIMADHNDINSTTGSNW